MLHGQIEDMVTIIRSDKEGSSIIFHRDCIIETVYKTTIKNNQIEQTISSHHSGSRSKNQKELKQLVNGYTSTQIIYNT